MRKDYPPGHPLQYSSEFVLVNEAIVSGWAGPTATWEDGIKFDNTFGLDTSGSTKIAEQQTVVNVYTGVVDRKAPVKAHSIIRRLEQDDYFRIESDPEDNISAPFNTYETKKFTARKIMVPGDVTIIRHYDAAGNRID